MKKIYSDIIQYRGEHYDFGFKQGEMLKGTRLYKNRLRQEKNRQNRYTAPVEEALAAIQSISPKIVEELYGLKDSLKISLSEMLNTYGGYLVEVEKSGCSVLTTEDYMVRNYDFHPFTYEGRFVLFQPDNGSYASIGPTQQITGRMDGMNEKGLSVAYNFVHRKNPGRGFIPNMVNRLMLEMCKNSEEAVQLLQEIPHFHSFNYIVLDETGSLKVIEATPRGVRTHESMVCTNHFEKLTEENRYHLRDSIRRQLTITNEQAHIRDPEDAFHLFNDPSQGVFSHKYKIYAGTIHTAMYFPKKKRLWFALGENREPLMIDFNHWLSGENLKNNKILGQLKTDAPFLHMDSSHTTLEN